MSISPELVRSFINLFRITAVFFCLDSDDDDSTRALTQSLAIGSTVGYSFHTKEHLVPLLLNQDKDKVPGLKLVVCNTMEKGNPMIFLPEIVWLFSDHELSPDLPLRLDSNVYTLSEGGQHMLEWYRIKAGPYIKQVFATMEDASDGEVVVSEVDHVWERRLNLMGTPIINTILEWNPFMVIQKGQPPTGMGQDVLLLLQTKLNFTLVYTSPIDKQWGSPVDPSSPLNFTGMVGMLARKEADVCNAGLTITTDRQNVIDFTIGFRRDVITFMAKRDNQLTPINYTAYINVFSTYSWGLIGLMILAVGVSTFVIRVLANGSAEAWGFVDGLAFAYNSLLQLSYGTVTGRVSIKVVILSVCLPAFFLYACYTADLTALMTKREPPPTIRSFADVLEHEYQVVVWKGTSPEEYLVNSQPGSGMHEVYNETMAGNPSAYVNDDIEGLEVLRTKEKTLFYASEMTFFGHDDIVVNRNLEDRIYAYLGIGLQKESEFRNIFDFYIISLYEDGHMDKLNKKWLVRDPKDTSDRIFVEGAMALGFDSVLFLSFIMFVGMTGSVATLALEKMTASCGYRRDKWLK